jgi:hypothetical protein
MGQTAQGLRRWQAIGAAAFGEVNQPVGSERPTTGIAGFGDAVGVEQQPVTGSRCSCTTSTSRPDTPRGIRRPS